MKNAKKEFIEHIANSRVKCAEISHGRDYGPDPKQRFILAVGFDEEQFKRFVSSLDFDYYNGFGGQELFGTIWYEDGTWSSRGEYDGSEWWEYNVCPPIPDDLDGSQRATES